MFYYNKNKCLANITIVIKISKNLIFFSIDLEFFYFKLSILYCCTKEKKHEYYDLINKDEKNPHEKKSSEAQDKEHYDLINKDEQNPHQK